MDPASHTSLRGAVSALMQSYAADLRRWVTRITVGYACALALLAVGFLAILAAIAVGVGFLFHFIAVREGSDVAYAVIGGGLLVAGLILLLAAWGVLKRRKPPIPRPLRQAQTAKRLMIRPSVLGVITRLRETNVGRAGQVTPVLVGAAATMLLSWIVVSRFRSRPQGPPASR
jgi:hypothetical protein